MRPNLLNPLFAALTSLAGIGPKQEKLFRRLLGRNEEPPRILHLLLHLPSGTVDRRARPKLRDVKPGSIVTVEVTIDQHRPPQPRGRGPYRIYAHDDTGDVILTYFSAYIDHLKRLYPVGAVRYVSGTAGLYDDMLQIVHPDRVVDAAGLATLPLVEPVYPLTEGIGLGQVQRAMDAGLRKLPELPEWQDEAWVAQSQFPAFSDALRALHRPTNPRDLDPASPAWARLAYDELLAGQLALALVRANMRRPAGRSHAGGGQLRNTIIAALPYRLTPSQQRAVADIAADLAKPTRMLRLLQGDVGSGKTVVALLASAAVVESGRQAALMAPTEILARQHLQTIAPLAEAADLRVAILTGRERGRERTAIIEGLAAGAIDL
ncbi:MAG: DEAD/DEAH box helicase, partial [Rhizobiales bacterium]|nr:DEAD/DEAH box helicase [Hyphomicrobiales bacterium]